ncbi:MAG: LuxR family transcriptional regulator [Nocardioidaceae bacterium]|nr:LuxR family transcriptional regulator [Nocardioidaceae bacterium]
MVDNAEPIAADTIVLGASPVVTFRRLERDRPVAAPHVLSVTVVNGGVIQVSGAPAEELIQLLRRGGLRVLVNRPRRTVDAGIALLSDREIEIVRGIARGMGNQQIADQSHLSINTIKSYIRSCYRKMNVENRTQAVIWAMQHGLGSTDPH